MNVTVSVAGRFRAFKLAAALEQAGSLQRIMTSFPLMALRNETVSPKRIRTFPVTEVVGRALARLPGRSRASAGYWKVTLYDTLASRHVADCDVFVGWAGCALRSIRRAKAAGALTFIERESTHIGFSERLLRREYEALGLPHAATDPRTVAMHLAEYEETDYIVVPSAFVHDSFVSEGIDRRKLITIPSGVDLERFHPAPKQDDIFRVIFVGALSIRKGVRHLLEAARRLKLPKFEVLLVGGVTDEVKPILERYAGLFKYGGKIPHAELQRAYSQSSVFVLPSLEEGMAYVVAEAMASGLPAVVTTNTGGADLIREGLDGFIVPICDAESLACRLLRLYEDEQLRRRMGESARQRVQEFTWSRYGANALAAYRERLGGSGVHANSEEQCLASPSR